MNKREFLAGIGVSAAAATALSAPALAQPSRSSSRPTLQREGVPHRRARTRDMFQSPEHWPNGMALAPEGLWVAEQLTLGDNPIGSSHNVHLMDWRGAVLKSFPTRSRNTSGLGFGGGYLWVGANAPPHGIFQMDTDGNTISHRQIPLGGGGCHGVEYYAGKLYIVSTRLRSVMRVDPDTWEPEFIFPILAPRYHETACDGGSIWVVAGTGGGAANVGGLHRYDLATGRIQETVDFVAGSGDPHGLLMHEGKLYSCDAGLLPGAPERSSPSSGAIFRIDFI